MNWVGGARSRIRISDEKRKQQEFFRKRKLASTCQKLKSQTQKSVPALSQDLLLFQALDSCFQKPKSITPKKVTQVDLDVLSKRRKIHRFDIELPLSPVDTPLKTENGSDMKVSDAAKMQQFSHSIKKHPFAEHHIELDFGKSAEHDAMSIYSKHVQTIQEMWGEKQIASNALPGKNIDNINDSVEVEVENRRNIAAHNVGRSLYTPMRLKKTVSQKAVPLISTGDFLKSNNFNSLHQPPVSKSNQEDENFPNYSEVNHKILTKAMGGSLDLAIFKERSLRMNKGITNETINHSGGDYTSDERFNFPFSTTFDSVSELHLSKASEKGSLLTQSHFSYSKSFQRASTCTTSKSWDVVKNGYSLYPVNNFPVELENHIPNIKSETDMHKMCLSRVSRCERVANPRKQENTCQTQLGVNADTGRLSNKKDVTIRDIQTFLNVENRLESLTSKADKHDVALSDHITKHSTNCNKENNASSVKSSYNGVNEGVSLCLDQNGCLHSENIQIEKDLYRSPLVSCHVADHGNSGSSDYDMINAQNREDKIPGFEKRILKNNQGHNIMFTTNQEISNKDEIKEDFGSVSKQKNVCEFPSENCMDKTNTNMNVKSEWPWKEMFPFIMKEIFNQLPLLASVSDQRKRKIPAENSDTKNTVKTFQNEKSTSLILPNSLSLKSENSNCKNMDNVDKSSNLSNYSLRTELKEETSQKNSTYAESGVITIDHKLDSLQKLSTILNSPFQNKTEEHKLKNNNFINLKRLPENNSTKEFTNEMADDVTKYFPLIHLGKQELEEEPIITQTGTGTVNKEESQISPIVIVSSKIEKSGEICKGNFIRSAKLEMYPDANKTKCTALLESKNQLQDASLIEVKGAISTNNDGHNSFVTYPILTTCCSQAALKLNVSENEVQKQNYNIYENSCKVEERLKSVSVVDSPVDSNISLPHLLLDSSFRPVSNSSADNVSMYLDRKPSPCKMPLNSYNNLGNTDKLASSCDNPQSKIGSCPSSEELQLADISSKYICSNKYKNVEDTGNKQCIQNVSLENLNRENQYCVYKTDKLSKATQYEPVTNHEDRFSPQRVSTVEASTQTQNIVADFGCQSVVIFNDTSTQTVATKVKWYEICDIS